jgi:hypothetical protein
MTLHAQPASITVRTLAELVKGKHSFVLINLVYYHNSYLGKINSAIKSIFKADRITVGSNAKVFKSFASPI